MKTRLSPTILETLFFTFLFLGLVMMGISQTDNPNNDAQKRVKVAIEVTENGKTSTSTQELELNRDNINGQLDEMIEEIEMILQEAVDDIEETDLEITIRRNRIGALQDQYRREMRLRPEFESAPHHRGKRALLGVYGVGIDSHASDSLGIESGAIVTGLVAGSAAESIGLQEGDIIVGVDEKQIEGFDQLARTIRGYQPGDEIEVNYLRDGAQMKSPVVLGEGTGFHENTLYRGPVPPVTPVAPLPGFKDWYGGHGHTWQKGDTQNLAERPFLGIVGKSEENGVVLTKIFVKSTAAEMGLKVGDKIMEIDKEEVGDIEGLVSILDAMSPGDEILVKYVRDGKVLKEKGTLKSKVEFKEDLFKNDHFGQNDFLPERFWNQRGVERYKLRIEVETVDREEIDALNEKLEVPINFGSELRADVRVFPNPSEGRFKLSMELEQPSKLEIKVFDQTGRMVYQEMRMDFNGRYNNTVDISDEPSGVYFLSITHNDQGVVKRLVTND